MITAVAIDDEPLALTVIQAFANKIDYLDLQKTFTEPNEALKHLRKYPVDLIFLDMRMPGMSGIDLYKSVSQSTMVIFTTSFSEYAVEGFNVSAVDFLLKPFDLARFTQAVNKARDYHSFLTGSEESPNKYIFLRADYSLHKIDTSEILYIEGLNNYLKIYLTNGKHLLVRMSMKAITEKLSPKAFVRVHRSFIVPLAKVEAMRNKTLHIGTVRIPIGTNYVEEVEELFGKD